MNPERIVQALLDIAGRELVAGRDFPALFAQIAQFAAERPLDGLSVLDGTPVFMNTLPKYAALIAGGADLTVVVRDGMMCDGRIPPILREVGIPFLNAKTDRAFDFVLDNAALNVDQIATRGRVELTRTGVHMYESLRLDVPVFSADGGRIKEIETVLGTGEGCLRAMLESGLDPEGKRVVLFGYGRVGRGIRYYLNRAGAEIVIVDPVRGSTFSPDMLDGAWAVISATGIHHAHDSIAEWLVGSDALLINMGADDEFGPKVPPERVLNHKYSFNFMLKEPTRTAFIDPTLALHNRGVLHILAAGGAATGIVLPPAELEDEILSSVKRAGFISDDIAKISSI